MKKIIFRIIGLIVLAFGAYALYDAISSILNSSGAMNFLVQISKITLAWVAIYGGYQALNARELGRKMLIAWLSYQALMIAFIALVFLYSFIAHPESNFNLSLSNQNLTIAFLIFCVSALIFLLRAKLDDGDLIISNYRQVQIVGKLLSVLSPGLGRMLVGNKLAGLVLFSVYLLLVTGALSSSNSEIQNLVVNSVYNLIVWGTFVKYDWYAVQNYGKPAQEDVTLAPKLNSSQVNGG